jgi:hypothetical protein
VQVTAREADNAVELATQQDQEILEQPPHEAARAVYELTAVVAHIQEEGFSGGAGRAGARPGAGKSAVAKREHEMREGHVIAHIKVCSFDHNP